MKLTDALKTLAAARNRPAATSIALVCGFEPLHLQTFLKAQFAQRFGERRLELTCGVYGDLEGNLARAAAAEVESSVVVVEWADLDPRLGVRSVGPWSGPRYAAIVHDVGARLRRLEGVIGRIASRQTLALVPPTLAWPLSGSTAGHQHSPFELALQHEISGFLARAAASPNVRVLHPDRLEALSATSNRHDPRSELAVGFPYRLDHASAVAQLSLDLLFPAAAKKGLITDLDGTLWAGLVGEVGADSVAWSQADGGQIHGLYQLTLRQLADMGVLIGVASKNDPTVVRSALARSDLWIDASSLFPVCTGWHAKSQSVAAILKAWNITAHDVVFVDDSPMELDEVQSHHPAIECLLFEPQAPERALRCCERLRDLFGRPTLTPDDGLRAASVRSLAAFEADKDAQDNHMAFVRGLQGVIRVRRDGETHAERALDLLNKTNQFNLNGRRVSVRELADLRDSADAFVLEVEYSDRYGTLGTVGVAAGRIADDHVLLQHWVLSCRAFSRHVEHHMLHAILQLSPERPLHLAYASTAKNGPLQAFLRSCDVPLDGADGPVLAAERASTLLRDLLPHTLRAADG